ncbi:Hypothetical Protein [Fusobacterium vincentii ATCC 49256]|uniref:Riboflavin synthase subunit alpha n=1 Tax=Fusobacterium vincentii ATCC 49256 TaxID=209882 RepID=Q7P2Q4_FUSVC|nr:hypothetical protein CS401_00395 [Fusobacterium vincentii]EAA24193.1 Hypothetical Protein [Fusobacterium vincentii ATCC 49256]
MQRILNFLLLRNLANNELFLSIFQFANLFFKLKKCILLIEIKIEREIILWFLKILLIYIKKLLN